MPTRITVKGQVTIPKHVREAAGLRPGDEVEVVADGSGQARLRRAGTRPYIETLKEIRAAAPLRGLDVDGLMDELRD